MSGNGNHALTVTRGVGRGAKVAAYADAAATAADTRRLLPSLSYAALACILEECRIAAAAERSVLFECVPDLSHVTKDERRSCQKYASESCEMSTARHWRMTLAPRGVYLRAKRHS